MTIHKKIDQQKIDSDIAMLSLTYSKNYFFQTDQYLFYDFFNLTGNLDNFENIINDVANLKIRQWLDSLYTDMDLTYTVKAKLVLKGITHLPTCRCKNKKKTV